MRLIIKIICILLFPVFANAFDLTVSISGGSGYWSNGVYYIDPSATVSFACTPSGGTAPYTYSWDFDHPPKGATITWRRDWDTDGDSNTGYDEGDDKWLEYSTEQNPSYQFLYPLEYDVWVHVKDAAGVVEKAVLKLSAPKLTGGAWTVYNAVTDAELVADGETDNTSKFNTWISGKSGKSVLLQFPAGTYRFVGEVSNNSWYGGVITASSGFIAQPLVNGSTVVLQLDIPFDSTGGECAAGDGTCDTDLDFFFNNLLQYGSYAVFKNLTINRDLNGQALSATSGCKISVRGSDGGTGDTSFQNCTIVDFPVPIANHQQTKISKNNFSGWGICNTNFQDILMHDYGGTSHTAGLANSLWRNNYSKITTDGSHAFYLGPDGEYVYVIGNYVDLGTNGNTNQWGLHIYGTADGTYTPLGKKYAYGNALLNIANDGAIMRSVDGTHPLNIIIQDNLFKTVDDDGLVVGGTSGAVNFSYNLLDTVAGNAFTIGWGSGEPITALTISNNLLKSVTGTPWDFISSDVSGCDGQEASLNPDGCTAVLTASGNATTATGTSITDPGVWAYVKPTISSKARTGTSTTIAATGGSGLTGTRWPYTTGAWMQVIDAANNHSQIKAYSTDATSWGVSPTFIRVADVDHNISDPYALGGLATIGAGPHSMTIGGGSSSITITP
jgi:hypothetical protein